MKLLRPFNLILTKALEKIITRVLFDIFSDTFILILIHLHNLNVCVIITKKCVKTQKFVMEMIIL